MKGCRKSVGGRSLRKANEGGPIDTYNHKFKSKSVISKHISEMEKDKALLDEQIQYEESKYNEKKGILEDKKNQDFQKQQADKEKDFQMYIDAKNQEIEHTNRAVSSFGHTTRFLVVEVIAPFIAWLVRQIKFLVMKIFSLLAWIWEQVFNLLDSIFNGSLMTAVYNSVAYLLAKGLLILLIIIIIFLFILFLLSLFTIKPIKWFGGKEGGTEGECVVPSEISINLNNFGKMYTFDKVGNNIQSKLDNILLTKPSYLEMPSFNYDFNDLMKKPFDVISKWFAYIYKSILCTEQVQEGLNTLRYTRNLGANTVDYLYGKDPTSVINRKEEMHGRSDNIINIDSKIFNDKKMLQRKNIESGNYVVNIGRPKDIEWSMKESEYKEQDYDRLPPSLLNKKDKKNISLNDKRVIIIPWIAKNNNYVLSCDNAYFKDNAEEKANVLIDTDDETCSINIGSKPVIYNDKKRRYKYTNDLGNFV